MSTPMVKLFCFPFAGGSEAVFHKWKNFAPPFIDVIPVALSGRGRRIDEPPYSNMKELIADLLGTLKPELIKGPYAFFGHSMGGLIAYVLGKEIQALQLPGPERVFISGKGAPHVIRPDKPIYSKLPRQEFIREILRLGGTPPGIFDNEDLANFFLPLLRSDFSIAETSFVAEDIVPLNSAISIVNGDEEDFWPEQVLEWQRYTSLPMESTVFRGGHFYINDHVQGLMQLIGRRLVDNTVFSYEKN